MSKTRRIILTILAIIGFALSVELCVVYYNANFAVNAHPSICAINDMVDCDSVARTSYSQFFGIPLSLWGVLLYFIFLFLTYVDKLQNIKFLGFLKVFKNPLAYIFSIGLFSFVMSMILGCISVFKINSICIFCFMTYFTNLLIAITAKTKDYSVIGNFKQSILDFVEALRVKKYAFWFSLIVLACISVLVYTSVSNVLSPQIAKQIELKKQSKFYKGITNGREMGPNDANIVIEEYMDFNCPRCLVAHLYMHRIVDEFKNVKVIQHNLPLEKACNHNMQIEGHKNSCLKSSYALAAAKQNMYWEMADILFVENPETEKEILEEARLLDFDIKKLKEDANSEEIKQEITDSVAEADKNEIVGTPTLIIGINKILGVGTYPEFKEKVIELGGIEKENHG